MDEEITKGDIFKWSMLVLLIILIFTAVGYVLRPVDKMVERAVLVNSHQYIEGMQDRAATLNAALAEIDARLSMGTDDETRRNLEIQRSTITVQLNAMRRN